MAMKKVQKERKTDSVKLAAGKDYAVALHNSYKGMDRKAAQAPAAKSKAGTVRAKSGKVAVSTKKASDAKTAVAGKAPYAAEARRHGMSPAQYKKDQIRTAVNHVFGENQKRVAANKQEKKYTPNSNKRVKK